MVIINKRNINKYVASSPSAIPPTPIVGDLKFGLVAAQSNLDGRNDIVDLPIDIVNPSLTVKFYNSGLLDFFDCTVAPPRFASTPSYSADTIMFNRLADNLGEDVYLVKKSRGGTCFFTPNPSPEKGDWNIASTGVNDHYLPFVQRILNTKNYCEKVLFTNFNPLFLWIDIVETDAIASTKALYKTNQTDFINAIRTLVGNPTLPIVAREMGSNQTGFVQDIQDAQNELATEITNYTLIPSTGFTMFDGVHLDASSTEDYATQVLAVVTPLYA